MKLLITTQIVDRDDPILGFFHRWLEEFATHFDAIEVICLKEGTHSLPPNVRVYSLGKEKGGNRVLYAFRFLKLAWSLRNRYDKVLVHMNPEYVILGGVFWKLWQKPINLWYNHPYGGPRLAIAGLFSKTVFHTSPYAASARFKHAKKMPAGIDVDIFKPHNAVRNRHLIYMQGRIMPSKRVALALEALRIIRETTPDATLILVGPEDKSYGKKLRTEFSDLVASGAVIFKGPVPNHETPLLYSGVGVSVNLAASGHFDKSVLEAMACSTPVIISSSAFSDIVPREWVIPEQSPSALASSVFRLFSMLESDYVLLGERLRDAVVKRHSLSRLSQELLEALAVL